MTPPEHVIELFDDDMLLPLAELARACAADEDWVRQLVAHGVIEAAGSNKAVYSAVCVSRLRKAKRLGRDFELNPPAIALVLELLDEIDRLKRN